MHERFIHHAPALPSAGHATAIAVACLVGFWLIGNPRALEGNMDYIAPAIGFLLVFYIFTSIINGLFILIWSKSAGGYKEAKYGRSYAVSYLASAIFTFIYFGLSMVIFDRPQDSLQVFNKIGLVGASILMMAIFTFSHGLSGAMIFKIGFMRSVRATLILPLINSVFMGIGFSMMPKSF